MLLTPLYWLDLGVPGMLVAQSVGLALAAPALFALSRSCGAPPPFAAVPAFLWLLCPWVAAVNLFEFRPDGFGPALIAIAVLAALHDRLVLLGATVLLTLGLKEDFSLTFLMLAVVLAVLGKRRLGVVLAGVSLIWFFGASLALDARSGSYDAFGRRFAGDRGESVREALVWAATHPLETASDVASQSLLALGALVLSTGGIALLAPLWLLLAHPPSRTTPSPRTSRSTTSSTTTTSAR